MSLPETCLLWTDPEAALARPMKDQFELTETLFKTSHHWRYILTCRKCRARYLFEFYEEIDWEDGEDPQWSIYVPVQSEAQLSEMRKACNPRQLVHFLPHLSVDFPKGAAQRSASWVGTCTGSDAHV